MGAGEDCCVDTPAEDTPRTGLDAEDGAAVGEGYWAAGWLRGEPSLSGSAGPISHFGGMIVCLGGRGSRRVLCRASWSGS